MVTTPTDLFRTRHMKAATLTNDEGDALVGNPSYSQDSHGFAVGDVVYRDSATTYAKATADASRTAKHGLSLVVWVSGSKFSVLRFANHQVVNIGTHSLGAFGTDLALSNSTAGAIVALSSVPAGLRIYLGFVVTATTIQWEPGWVPF